MNRLTLVLTSYNRLSFLNVMVESLQKQSNLDFDLIICDNHSTDGSWQYIDQIIKFNNGEYVKLCWEDNKGWAGSAERWRDYIRTDWVSILSDDDWLGVNYVSCINSVLFNDDFNFMGLIVIGHKRINIEKKYEKDFVYSSKILDIEPAIEEFYSQKFDVAGISGFVIQSSILRTGFPRYYDGNGFLEDTLIIYRALLLGGAMFLSGIHYFRREHLDNISASNRKSIYYRLALVRFKHDIKLYAEKACIRKSLKSKLIRYTIFDHFKGLAVEIFVQNMSLGLYKEYMHNIKRIDMIKFYQSLGFYTIFYFVYCYKNIKSKITINRN